MVGTVRMRPRHRPAIPGKAVRTSKCNCRTKLMSGKMRNPSDYKLKGIASAAGIHLAPDQARIMTEQTRKLRYLIECRNYDLELDERDNRKTELPPPLDRNDDPESQG